MASNSLSLNDIISLSLSTLPPSFLPPFPPSSPLIVPVSGLSPAGRATAASVNIRKLSQNNLIIPGRHLKLLDTVGQGDEHTILQIMFVVVVVVVVVVVIVAYLVAGEFGVVYRGHLTGWQERVTAELVAIKTLKSQHKN